MNLRESIKRILNEDRVYKLAKKYVNQFGIYETAKMMGLSMTKIAEITNIPINPEIANELLLENLQLKNLKREYKEFKIYPSMDGVFYWETHTNTGHFLPNMMENIAVVATPFWDGGDDTPVELDWYTLYDGDGKVITEVSGNGTYFHRPKHQTHFKNIHELFNWYEEYYLPKIYDLIMNKILPRVHQVVDDRLDENMGY